MRIPLSKSDFSFLRFRVSAFASDNLNVKSFGKNWQLDMVLEVIITTIEKQMAKHQINFPDRPANERSIINQYIDTGNIACYAKNIGILITRKIWKPFSCSNWLVRFMVQEGYMYARDIFNCDQYGTFIDSR
jgi:hypothetical protein